MRTLAKSRSQGLHESEPAPTMRVLVASTGDRGSLGALHVAAELARTHGADVLALGVVVPLPYSVTAGLSPMSPGAVDEEDRRDTFEAIRDRLAELPEAAKWSERVVIGWPTNLINDTAEEWQASLVVLGIGRHGRIERVLGDETAISVVRHARRPVLAVPARVRALPHNAVAAVDFTPASLAAAALAADLLGPGGTLHVAHACAFGGAMHDGDFMDLYRAGAQAKLDEAVHALRHRTHRRVEGVLLDGEAGKAVLAFARRERCDLIALGGHEMGLLDRIILGSVRTRVIRAARCAVLVAPPAGAR